MCGSRVGKVLRGLPFVLTWVQVLKAAWGFSGNGLYVPFQEGKVKCHSPVLKPNSKKSELREEVVLNRAREVICCVQDHSGGAPHGALLRTRSHCFCTYCPQHHFGKEGRRVGGWGLLMWLWQVQAMGNLTVSIHKSSLCFFLFSFCLSCDGLWFHWSLVLSFDLK